MIQVGVMLMSDRGPDGQPMDWRQHLQVCRECGVRKVDLFDSMLARVGTAPAGAKQVLDDLGLAPSVYCVPTDLVSPDPDVRRTSLDTVRRGLDICADLGLDHLWVVYPGDQKYALDEKITVIPLEEISQLV